MEEIFWEYKQNMCIPLNVRHSTGVSLSADESHSMPTTCGFPNCKFRSRYRGQEDNRHFYRIPKRPLVLRQRWLKAIGRTEETVVSQLRICSAHFKDGEKREGDIPVPDPELDPPIAIILPPKESKSGEKRRLKPPTMGTFGSNSSSVPSIYEQLGFNSTLLNQNNSANHSMIAFANALKCAQDGRTEPNGRIQRNDEECSSRNDDGSENNVSPALNPFLHSALNADSGPFHENGVVSILSLGSRFGNGILMRPLVALLDGRDCGIEMGLLKDVATVAFCDAQTASEIHERVLNEAVVALVYNSIKLQRDDLQRFKCLKAIIRIGPGTDNLDLTAATQLGIAVCHTSSQCVEERADSTLSMILNLYRKTAWITKAIQSKSIQGIEQLREVAAGTQRPRGSRLVIIGLGRVGIAVALRAKAFGFVVGFHDPEIPDGVERSLDIIRHRTLEDAVSQADCITFHCPVNSKTKRFISMSMIRRMKKGVLIVNISSEQLFVESDLMSALKSGQIGAAAFDCYDLNSSNSTNSIASLPNVLCTPKVSWYSEVGCKELREAASRETRRVITGKFPGDLQHCVNKGSLLPSSSGSNFSANFSNNPFPLSGMNPLSGTGTNDFLGLPTSSAFQNLFMMNPQMMMRPPNMASLYPGMQQLMNQMPNSFPNGTLPANGRKRSVTPKEERPSSSSSGNPAANDGLGALSAQTNGDISSSASPTELLKQLIAKHSNITPVQSPSPSSANDTEANEENPSQPTEENDSSPPPKVAKTEEPLDEIKTPQAVEVNDAE